ncbi:MAG TPA: hypothetical protein VF638_05470 [Sphingomonas sp.]|jgi:hypothetical protein
MSNRADLVTCRTTLLDLDEPLRAAERAVPSCSAAVQIARARAMVHAAEQLLAEALRGRVDGLPDASRLPAAGRASA